MIVSIHQPNFFPWLGYFYKIKSSDKFVLLDNVDIVLGSKDAITHRTRILTPQGEYWLSLPLHKGESKKINQLLVDEIQDWRNKQLKTLYVNYRKSSNFEFTYNWIEALYSNIDSNLLSAINGQIINKVCALLDIQTEIFQSSDLEISSEDKNDRIIEICKSIGASKYLSGNGAKKYNDESKYIEANIELDYISFNHPMYKHFNSEKNILGLSIIDVLMNNSVEQVCGFLNLK